MGKAAKAHRAKVAKRNKRIAQEKSGMQKAFDLLLKEQLSKLDAEKEIAVELGDQSLNFEVMEDRIVDHAFKFQPNPEESSKINKEFEEQNLPEEDLITNVEYKERNMEMVYDTKHNSPTKEEN